MIYKIDNELDAKQCDNFLGYLISDEAKNYDDTLLPKVEICDYYTNVINKKNDILLGYKQSNKLIGYIYAKYFKDSFQEKNIYVLDALYVDKDYRNNKVATKLITEVIEEIKKRKVKYIEINVMAQNSIALKLYKKLGFKDFKFTLRKDISEVIL